MNLEKLQDKVSDYFYTNRIDDFPFFRVEDEETIMIVGRISVNDMKNLISIFEGNQNERIPSKTNK